MSWPKAVIDFEEFLKGAGLQCERREEEASFSNKLIQCSGPLTRVRVVSDRGLWYVEVAGTEAGSCSWFDTAILRDLLLGPGEDVLPLQEQVDFIEKHWHEISSCFAQSQREQTCARLTVLRRERANRRLPRFFPPPAVN